MGCSLYSIPAMCNADAASQSCRLCWFAAAGCSGRRGKTMRIGSLAAALLLSVCSWQAVAQNVGVTDLEDFNLNSAQDLADLCDAKPGDELYAEAKQFCYGFLSGVVHFHDALAAGPRFGRIVCPEGKVTRDDGVAMFVAWATAHPDEASTTNPAEALVKAAVDKWGRCQQKS
jgi:Rap1a immunity proteins